MSGDVINIKTVITEVTQKLDTSGIVERGDP
jgi:hypothetical protein